MSLLQFDRVEHHHGIMTAQGLQKIQDDICRFFMREVMHESGEYFNIFSELREAKCEKLVN